MIPLRRRVVARLHRAFGDDFGVLVKDQVLDRFDFPIGHIVLKLLYLCHKNIKTL